MQETNDAANDYSSSVEDREAAMRRCRSKLESNPRCEPAIVELFRLRLPGDDYLVWLSRLYKAIKAESVIEIGVFSGASLARVPSTALAIGIDPSPQSNLQLPP